LLTESQVLKLCTVALSLLKENGIFFGQTVLHKEAIITRQPNDRGGGLRFLHCVSSLKQLLENIGFKKIEISTRSSDMPDGESNSHMGLFYGVKCA